MSDDAPFEPDRLLFEQWRSHPAGAAIEPPDMLTLAAYLEGRLDEGAAQAVEAALAADAMLLDLVLELRQPIEPESVPPAVLVRAQALVGTSSNIVPLRREARRDRLGPWAAWGAVAASLVLVSMVGFNLGISTEQDFGGTVGVAAASETSNDLFYQSSPTDDGLG